MARGRLALSYGNGPIRGSPFVGKFFLACRDPVCGGWHGNGSRRIDSFLVYGREPGPAVGIERIHMEGAVRKGSNRGSKQPDPSKVTGRCQAHFVSHLFLEMAEFYESLDEESGAGLRFARHCTESLRKNIRPNPFEETKVQRLRKVSASHGRDPGAGPGSLKDIPNAGFAVTPYFDVSEAGFAKQALKHSLTEEPNVDRSEERRVGKECRSRW